MKSDEADRGGLGIDLVQRLDHLTVARPSVCLRPVVRRPREPGCLASALHRDPVLLGHDPDCFARGGRRQSFRPRTSLIAAFSRARSAYMRLSLAFSTSSSFRRLSSATEAPPYFDFPVVVRGLADPVLPQDLRDRQSCLAFLKNRHDLRFAELRLLHRTSPDSKSCQKSPLANVYWSGALTRPHDDAAAKDGSSLSGSSGRLHPSRRRQFEGFMGVEGVEARTWPVL